MPIAKTINKKHKAQKKEAVTGLVQESSIDLPYSFMLILATLVISMGVALDSEAIVIGGMLLAPFLFPIMALSLAIVTFSPKAIIRGLTGVFGSILLVITFSAAVSYVFQINTIPARQVFARGEFSYIYLFVAFFSGLGASYIWIRPKLSNNLAGIAVAVSLIPPLCIAGMSIANFNNALAWEVLKIFSSNLIGILIASIFVFTLEELSKYKKVQDQEIDKEQKIKGSTNNTKSGKR